MPPLNAPLVASLGFSSLAAGALTLLLTVIPSLRRAERYRRRHEVLAGPRRGARLPD